MNAATKRLAWLIFEPLVERKKLGVGVRCRLCEDYKSSDRLITFRLKKGVLWHDGVRLSAQDVAFTYAPSRSLGTAARPAAF
jgi:ABC-type transport system substrate-binding protein